MRSAKGNRQNQKIELPEDVKRALEVNQVRADFDARPAHQRNEYLAWITHARQPETRSKRLTQMLSELQRGGVFMRNDHPASKK